MRIAITGARGQLATELCRQLGTGASAFSEEVILLDRTAADITDAAHLASVLDAIRPHWVINTAAYNFVDRAEDEPEVAYAANGLGPRNLAAWCAKADATLLHVSTDYVFPGTIFEGTCRHDRSVPYTEDDLPSPVSAYGVSKLAGEYFVRSLCRKHFVVRTCGLYGRAQGSKGNFVETMLRLGRERPELRVVDDQRCTPTSAADLAVALVALIKTEAYGLYHATNAGETTWFRFAKEIFRQVGLEINLQPTTTAAYGAKARRPTYSVLACKKLEAQLGQPLRPWQEALADYLRERLPAAEPPPVPPRSQEGG